MTLGHERQYAVGAGTSPLPVGSPPQVAGNHKDCPYS